MFLLLSLGSPAFVWIMRLHVQTCIIFPRATLSMCSLTTLCIVPFVLAGLKYMFGPKYMVYRFWWQYLLSSCHPMLSILGRVEIVRIDHKHLSSLVRISWCAVFKVLETSTMCKHLNIQFSHQRTFLKCFVVYGCLWNIHSAWIMNVILQLCVKTENYVLTFQNMLMLRESCSWYSICNAQEQLNEQHAQKNMPDLGRCFAIGPFSWLNCCAIVVAAARSK